MSRSSSLTMDKYEAVIGCDCLLRFSFAFGKRDMGRMMGGGEVGDVCVSVWGGVLKMEERGVGVKGSTCQWIFSGGQCD